MWAFVFPGQGSQHVGMGRFLFDNFSSVKHLFEEASDALKISFTKLCFDGSESDLRLTENTQPALLLVSTAYTRVLEQISPLKAQYLAGHSLGEYSALVAAYTLNFSQALQAVRLRGQAMQQAVPVGKGAMVAVLGIEDKEVEQLCTWVEKNSGKTLKPANYNAPGQVVISGEACAVDWMEKNFSLEALPLSKKPKFIRLNVSAPFHCPLMKSAQDKMALVLKDMTFSEPLAPIIQNVTAKAEKDPQKLRQNLIEQVSQPVRWAQSVREMKQLGVKKIVELGPGKVLAGLVKKIDSTELTTFNIQDLEGLKAFEKPEIGKV